MKKNNKEKIFEILKYIDKNVIVNDIEITEKVIQYKIIRLNNLI